MPAVSRLNRILLALLLIALAVLHGASSGGFRFGGEEEEGSGFGGTGRAPPGGSGLGGTGFKPWLSDAGEVRVRPEPEATSIAEQIGEQDIPEIPAVAEVQPPAAEVTAAAFAAEHPAEVSITDAIQTQLRRDAVIYQRIVESVEGYYPPEAEMRLAPPETPPAANLAIAEPAPDRVPAAAGEIAAAPALAENPAPAPQTITGPGQAPAAEPAPSAEASSWAELVHFLVENQAPETAEETTMTGEATQEPPALRRPNRIRRPELPPVQRGRVVQRPIILPPRIQPLGL